MDFFSFHLIWPLPLFVKESSRRYTSRGFGRWLLTNINDGPVAKFRVLQGVGAVVGFSVRWATIQDYIFVWVKRIGVYEQRDVVFGVVVLAIGFE